MIIIALRNFICLIGLIAVMPFLIICCCLIFIEDGLPFFFKQERVGWNQRVFTIFKLRTLKNSAPQVGTHELDESYKLKLGKFIRVTKLDEFPQLFNVIKGDLNLVGPRPGLEKQLELQKNRVIQGIFDIKPGITGLSQILGYDMSIPNRLAKVDKLYIQNQSLLLDLIILAGTFVRFPGDYLASKFDIPNLRQTL
ncbi:sugar transferase [Gammaproteobacteria bacterium]|nr:sugar transferase [Gammaproteobacteria bacterium]MDA9174469.1 sugar transferase [Gammaproteobacteria bacterium]MDA9834635.1 sugar transferase [Gammaproteobacteria bacterium]MDA9979672.1 sugar transferase [Gammaproteobacteria bacterium]MDC3371949.1 sugar transferase [Gammaproteobacteria bacterium]